MKLPQLAVITLGSISSLILWLQLYCFPFLYPSFPFISLSFLHKSELGQGGLLVSTWDARHMSETRGGLVDLLTAVAPDGFLMCLTHDPESVSRPRASFY